MSQKKIGEKDIEHAVLDILDMVGRNNINGYVDITTIKSKIHEKLKPEGENLKILKDRSDQAIDQIVRNIVSHRKSSTENMIYKKFATYNVEKGLKITELGLKALETYRNIDLQKKLEK